MFQHLIKIAKLELNVYVENDRVTTIPTKITGELNLSRYNAENQQKWQIGVASEDYDHVKTPDIMQEKVLSLIDEYSNHDNHFFIYYPTPLVHGPLLPSEKDLKKSGIGIYGDFVLQVDRYVGEIVDSLKSKNIFDDTMIIFTSDNGASAVANFPYLLSIGHNPSNGLRGKKAEIWEGGNTKPNIITYPRIIKSGSESKGLIRHTDFFWTLSYILSNKLEDNTAEDSYSNLEVLKGNKDTVREFIVYSSGNGGLSIRNNEWKLTFVSNGGSEWQNLNEFKPSELYRMDVDNEHVNLIDSQSEVVEKLKSVLEKYI